MSPPTLAGDTLDPLDPRRVISAQTLDLVPLDYIVQWRRCGLTADYLAAFLAYHVQDRERARALLSGCLNELIENLVKFSDDKRQRARLSLSCDGDRLRIETHNLAAEHNARALAARLDRLAAEDPELLFLEQLERTATEERGASGLGLLTLKKDHGARIGLRITPVEGQPGRNALHLLIDLDLAVVAADPDLEQA